MRKLSASKAALVLALAASAAGAGAGAGAGELKFDEAFATKRTPSIHYEASFRTRGGAGQKLEAWRDGGTRVRRRTNDAVETIAVRQPGDAEYELTVLDLQRKLLTRIDRTNLYRIGNFTDWFDLAHALKHPKSQYTLVKAAAPGGAQRPIAPCTWYDLGQQGRTSHVCWSTRSQLPLAIVDDAGTTVWRVTRLAAGRIAPGTFRVDTRDYVVNDANRDIEHD